MGTNTGIGIGIGIPFKNNALGGDRPYLPPELKARLLEFGIITVKRILMLIGILLRIRFIMQVEI